MIAAKQPAPHRLPENELLGLDLRHASIRPQRQALGAASPQRLLQAMGCAVLVTDRERRVLGANPAASRLLRLDENELMMRDVADLLQEGCNAPLDAIEETLRSGAGREVDGMLVAGVGREPIPVEVRCTALPGEGDAIEGVVLCLTDQRHRWRIDLMRSTESRVLGLVASGAALDAILVEVTAGLERLFPGAIAAAVVQAGQSRQARVISGTALPAIMLDAIRWQAAKAEQQLAPLADRSVSCAGETPAGEASSAPAAGAAPAATEAGMSTSWSFPILGDGGDALGSLVLLFDTPRAPAAAEFATVAFLAPLAAIAIEREQRSRALRISQERLTCVVDAAMDAFRDWGLDADRLWWNRRPDSHFAFPEDGEETDSARWLAMLHPDDRERVRQGIAGAVAAGASQWESRYRVLRPDGSYGHVLDRAVLVRDETGKATRLIGGMMDISDQIRMEEQLHQIQRLESIGQLSGGIAHDFNNLLTVILGNAELMTDLAAQHPALRTLAETIAKAAERGADLTQRLLAFGRRQALAPRSIDLAQRVEDQLPMLRRLLGESIEVRFARCGLRHAAMVDPAQLDNALLNLCINARDAMPTGGRLDIRIDEAQVAAAEPDDSEALPPGRYVSLAVEDSGCGIPPESLAHVFEPFYTTKEVGKGTGLGLPMVYGFVRQSGGQVRLRSACGQGTCVTLLLPPGPALESSPPETRAERPEGSAQGRILVVEDDALVREFAAEQVRSLGYEVSVARDSGEALALLRTGAEIDLLFTDVAMPGGMSGLELAAAAARLRPGLRVLLASGYAEGAMQGAARAASDLPLLGKPYRRAELARRLAQALASPGSGERSSA